MAQQRPFCSLRAWTWSACLLSNVDRLAAHLLRLSALPCLFYLPSTSYVTTTATCYGSNITPSRRPDPKLARALGGHPIKPSNHHAHRYIIYSPPASHTSHHRSPTLYPVQTLLLAPLPIRFSPCSPILPFPALHIHRSPPTSDPGKGDGLLWEQAAPLRPSDYYA